MDSRYRADRGLSTAMRDQVLRLAILAALSTAVAAQPGPPQLSREWYAQFSGPFSQPQGHVLIDTGMAELQDSIVSSVEPLGFKAADIRIMLSNPNGGVPLFNNPRHRNVVEDTRRAFRTLKSEPEPDIVLVGHPQAMFAGTMEHRR